MDPAYGGGFIENLFEYADSPVLDLLKSIFIGKVSAYLPSIIIEEDDISYEQEDTTIRMHIMYRVNTNAEMINSFSIELSPDNYINF